MDAFPFRRPGTASRWRVAAGLLSLAVLVGAVPARAGGGAHVVDDATVETPGTCHLESWLTRGDGARGLLDLSPACTREAWPDLEIGAAVQRAWDGAGTATSAGPTLKRALRSPDRGPGVALAAGASWSLDHGTLETASVVVPVTLALDRRWRANLNAGWLYSRGGGDRQAAFWGAQLEAQVSPDCAAMVEVFGRDRGPAGGQAGWRWTPHGGAIDVDLVAGRYVDGADPFSLTLGVTLRH